METNRIVVASVCRFLEEASLLLEGPAGVYRKLNSFSISVINDTIDIHEAAFLIAYLYAVKLVHPKYLETLLMFFIEHMQQLMDSTLHQVVVVCDSRYVIAMGHGCGKTVPSPFTVDLETGRKDSGYDKGAVPAVTVSLSLDGIKWKLLSHAQELRSAAAQE